MSEHFTRNTESIRCWCTHCGGMTEHTVSDGNIGRCVNDHTKHKHPTRAVIPSFTLEDVVEVHNVDTAGKKHAVSIKDRLHIAALEGPNYQHDTAGNLPAKKERKK